LRTDDQLSLLQLLVQTFVLPPQGSNLDFAGTLARFAATRLRRQRLQSALVSQPSPRGQLRGVQAFTTQQGAYLAALGTLVGFFDDAQFVGGAEASPNCLGHDFRFRLSDRLGAV
jgi:hypothetical protein